MATLLLARRLGGFLGSIIRILVLSWVGRLALRPAAVLLRATSVSVMSLTSYTTVASIRRR